VLLQPKVDQRLLLAEAPEINGGQTDIGVGNAGNVVVQTGVIGRAQHTPPNHHNHSITVTNEGCDLLPWRVSNRMLVVVGGTVQVHTFGVSGYLWAQRGGMAPHVGVDGEVKVPVRVVWKPR